MDAGAARVVGFDPNPRAIERLNSAKRPNETYLPHAIGDGRPATLHVCAAEGMTSILEPDQSVLRLFGGFPEWGRVLETHRIETVRLDDVAELRRVDLLKLDIQGAELTALENAERLLRDCLVVQLEAEFVPLYKGQPLFSEVEQFMRARGFWVNRLAPTVSRALQPLVVGNDYRTNYGQVAWCDAVFVRGVGRLEELSDDELLRLAFIAADVYRAHDLAARSLHIRDTRRGEGLAAAFLAALSRSA